MANFFDTDVLYGPQYLLEGVPATLVLSSGVTFEGLTAIDLTRGVAIGGPIEIEGVRPGASLLVSELTTKGLTMLAHLDGATLTLSPPLGAASIWRVSSYRERPSTNGIADGEVILLLAPPA